MTVMNIHPVIERKALALAAKQGVALDKLIEEALVRLLEDEWDIAAAEEALRDYDPTTNVPLKEVKRRLGLDG
ncbi:MAG TPA: hypothetical protein VFS87_02025 [Qipengyuania sp.]|nr:hypothetical protein [Qipengyuania sp.]